MSPRRPTLAERRRAAISRNGELAPLLPPTGAFVAALGVVVALVLVGLVMVLSASSIVAINNGGSPWNMFRRQLLWAAFGLLAGLASYRMPYRVWGALSPWFLGMCLGLMALPFVPGVGVTVNGARAWVERLQGRFFAFLNLEESRADQGYQVWQSILSISNGGILGTGAGEGTSKWGYVPLAHSDFIFAVVAEEFGLIGSAIVLGGFLVLLGAGLRASLRAVDAQGALLASGITAWLCIQAAINIGGVVGALPVTGLTLPFISYGGSSLFAVMAASGLLLNVARHPKP
ncbi:MAG: hypothetical protein EBU70_03960 [Actinobacteria bacterium]|nr:hypothetical protein [Actinomycetota bacterium]